MSHSQQQRQNHLCSSFEHHVNHQHRDYRCYLRTPDMKCKIQSIATNQSVSQLKQYIKNVLDLKNASQASSIKLIVNEIQLTDQMNLALHLYQNAIIHVIEPSIKSQEEIINEQVSIRIKQPPINCPTYVIEKINPYTNVKRFKEKVLSFYKIQHHDNQIASLNQNQLYLVFGGRILTDDKVLWDYNVDENGVVYVINGRIYAKQVTKQQAQKRMEEVKKQGHQNKCAVESSSQEHLNQQNQNVVFNIIQNIVHDQDSDVEGQAQKDISRSQKIIQRYDSLNEDLQKRQFEDEIKQETVENGSELPSVEQKSSVEQYLQNVGNKIIHGERPTYESQGHEYEVQTSQNRQTEENDIDLLDQ